MFILAHSLAFGAAAFATLVFGHNFVPGVATPSLVFCGILIALGVMTVALSWVGNHETDHKTDPVTPLLSLVAGMMFGKGLFDSTPLSDPLMLVALGALAVMIIFDLITPWVEKRAEARRTARLSRRHQRVRTNFRFISLA